MELTVTGSCYCGEKKLHSTRAPKAVAYCHCDSCRRVTGAPVAAFAAFDEEALSVTPSEGKPVSINEGVTRTFCERCGTPLTGRYHYLPGTVYVPLGILDQADQFPPDTHAHEGNRFAWLDITDQCKRFSESARDELNSID